MTNVVEASLAMISLKDLGSEVVDKTNSPPDLVEGVSCPYAQGKKTRVRHKPVNIVLGSTRILVNRLRILKL